MEGKSKDPPQQQQQQLLQTKERELTILAFKNSRTNSYFIS